MGDRVGGWMGWWVVRVGLVRPRGGAGGGGDDGDGSWEARGTTPEIMGSSKRIARRSRHFLLGRGKLQALPLGSWEPAWKAPSTSPGSWEAPGTFPGIVGSSRHLPWEGSSRRCPWHRVSAFQNKTHGPCTTEVTVGARKKSCWCPQKNVVFFHAIAHPSVVPGNE